jgi:hypothetical protein
VIKTHTFEDDSPPIQGWLGSLTYFLAGVMDFEQFDDVSLMAAEGIGAGNLRVSTCRRSGLALRLY